MADNQNILSVELQLKNKKVFKTGYYMLKNKEAAVISGMIVDPTYVEFGEMLEYSVLQGLGSVIDVTVAVEGTSYAKAFKSYTDKIISYLETNKINYIQFENNALIYNFAYEYHPTETSTKYYGYMGYVFPTIYNNKTKKFQSVNNVNFTLTFHQVEGVLGLGGYKLAYFIGPSRKYDSTNGWSQKTVSEPDWDMAVYVVMLNDPTSDGNRFTILDNFTKSVLNSGQGFDFTKSNCTYPWHDEPTSRQYTWVTNTLTTSNNQCVYTGNLTSSDDPINEILLLVDTTDTKTTPGGASQPGGGKGDFDDSSDDILEPELPDSAVLTGSGLVTMYAPTLAEVASLSEYLWTDFFDLSDNLKKMISDPIDFIISLSLYPFGINMGTSKNIKIGYMNSGVSAHTVASQFMTVDCGSLNVNEYWGNCLDYAPYTKMTLYLPFIGHVSLNTDECMSATLTVKYNIDLLTGSCVATLRVTKDNLNSVLYQFSGNCGYQIPITSTNFSNIYSAIAKTVATAVIGAVAPPMMAGVSDFGNGMEAWAMEAPKESTMRNVARNTATSATGMIGMKAGVARSGSLSASHGILGVKTPYITIERPVQSLAKDYNKMYGYPSNITEKLGNISGMTVVESVHLDTVPCTEIEKSMIESLLKGGVIL